MSNICNDLMPFTKGNGIIMADWFARMMHTDIYVLFITVWDFLTIQKTGLLIAVCRKIQLTNM